MKTAGDFKIKSVKKTTGIIMIAVGFLCFILGIIPTLFGIGNFFLGVFGIIFYPLMLFICLVGIAFTMNLKYNFDRKFIVYLFSSMIFVCCLLHTIFTSNILMEKFNTFDNFGAYLSSCFNMQYGITVGGVIFALPIYILRCLFGLGATYVIFAVLSTLFIGLFLDYIIERKNEKIRNIKKTTNKGINKYSAEESKSVFDQAKYIEELDEKLNSSKSEEQDLFENQTEEENKEQTTGTYEFNEILGVNKTRENDEDYTAAYKTLYGDTLNNTDNQDVEKEEVKNDFEESRPKSAQEVLFGDKPAIPNIFDRDPSERNAWRRQYSSQTLRYNEEQNQEKQEEKPNEDLAFEKDDGLVKTSWGTYRPTANIRNSTIDQNKIEKDESVESENINQETADRPIRNIFGSDENINLQQTRNVSRVNRDRNQNVNTISRINQEEQTDKLSEVEENAEFGSRLSRADRRVRGNDLLADASALGIKFKEVDSGANNNQLNQNVFAEKQAEENVFETRKQENKPEKREQASFVSQLNRKYNAPPTSLLSLIKEEKEDHSAEYKQKSEILETTLDTFKIPAKVINVVRGPKVTRYELSMPIGIPVSRVLSYERDMTMALAAKNGIRIEAPIPGKNAFGVEVANDTSTTVGLRELIESPIFQNFKGDLPVAIGKNISGEIIVKSLSKMVHLLVAGSTGSGKSVFLHSLIMSLMYRHSPEELRFIMIDPKRVEFAMYNRMPHLMLPEVVSDTSKAINALNWAVKEMERRYQLLVDNGCQKIDQYNNLDKVKKGEERKLPYLVIVVDELAELMGVAKKDVEGKIQRITQLGRASGIHMVVATQRPSVDIVTGVIKNNMPTRIAFSLSSAVDSRTILDEVGAEKLLGQGDMLYGGQDSNQKIRLQAAFVPDNEIRATIQYIKDNNISEYDEEIQKEIYAEPEQEEEESGKASVGGASERQMDELMPQALKLVMKNGKASISMIQRRFQVGYARAARIIDQMETQGFIDGGLGNKPRDIKITIQEYNELFGNFDSDN